PNGDLMWYRHDGQDDGSFVWRYSEGKKVGVGWDFKQVFYGGPGSPGIIYGVLPNGDLMWYRHEGREDGSFTWTYSEGKKVGVGWDFKQVFFG
ncbi:MAG TPA: tachylectin-related carbohydrate-binding protein, partial [Chloroflexia bacterium]